MIQGVTTTGLVLAGLVALSGLASAALALAFSRRDVEAPSDRHYARLMLASAGLSFAYLAELLASRWVVVVAADFVYLGFTVLMAVFFLEFTVTYAGYGGRLTRRRRGLLYTYFGGYYLLVVTNPLHGWLRRDVTRVTFEGLSAVDVTLTPLMWGLTSLIYGFVVVGLLLIGRFFFAARNVYRKQTATILLGGLVIGGGNLLHWTGLLPVVGFDPTPLLFGANGLLIGFALARYDFLEVVPLAADMLIEGMDDPVVVVDAAGEVLDANAAARALFGTDPVGEPLPDVAPDLAASVASGEQFTRETPDGPTTYDPRTTVIADQYGIERGTLVVLRDVTVQVERQTELERQNERLEAFASVVSHDLRNPLAVAHGYAQLAVDEDDASYVAQTLDSLDRMNELIGDLLALAREGEAVDEVATVALADMAHQAWRQVDTGDATLVVETDATVQADDRRLRQLFENLFRNAVEHAGPSVTVTVGALAGDAGFFVADDGPGIPLEDRERVFEHGYSSSPDGTGFGLAIVRTIAEAHGWQVAVTESGSGGARFEVTGAHLAQSRAGRRGSASAVRADR